MQSPVHEKRTKLSWSTAFPAAKHTEIAALLHDAAALEVYLAGQNDLTRSEVREVLSDLAAYPAPKAELAAAG